MFPFLEGNRSGFGLPHCLGHGKLEHITTIIITRPFNGHILNQICISQEFLPLSGSLQIWWGLEEKQNTHFPALLAPASVSSSPQVGPHLISGTIRIFWCYFGAHKKWWQCWDHGLLGDPRSIRENYRLRSVFLNWHWALHHNQTFL